MYVHVVELHKSNLEDYVRKNVGKVKLISLI